MHEKYLLPSQFPSTCFFGVFCCSKISAFVHGSFPTRSWNSSKIWKRGEIPSKTVYLASFWEMRNTICDTEYGRCLNKRMLFIEFGIEAFMRAYEFDLVFFFTIGSRKFICISHVLWWQNDGTIFAIAQTIHCATLGWLLLSAILFIVSACRYGFRSFHFKCV